MLLHPLRWARWVIAVLLCMAVGVLDHQAFRWVPLLQPLYFSGMGHALLLLATGVLAGVLLRSWWAIILALLAYVVGFEAAIEVVSGTLGGVTDVQHLLWLLITASGPAVPLALGGGTGDRRQEEMEVLGSSAATPTCWPAGWRHGHRAARPIQIAPRWVGRRYLNCFRRGLPACMPCRRPGRSRMTIS